MNPKNPEGKDIRFIDTHYNELFKVSDGDCIQINYGNETVIKPCVFIDEYHTQVGYNVFHICEFAEVMERNGNTYQKEPEIIGNEAAWKIGIDKYLAMQINDDCFDYALYDENYMVVADGLIAVSEMSFSMARKEILESHHIYAKEFTPVIYAELMELAFEVGKEMNVRDGNFTALAEKLDQFAEDFMPYEYRDAVEDKEQHIESIRADLIDGSIRDYKTFLKHHIVEINDTVSAVQAKDLLRQLEKLCKPKKESVLTKLSQKSEILPKAKSEKHKEPER